MDPSLNQINHPHNPMNLHPPAHMHNQQQSHNSQHSNQSQQQGGGQQRQGGGGGGGVNVDDMFHQETGLDDADDEDDGDGESTFFLCLFLLPWFHHNPARTRSGSAHIWRQAAKHKARL